MNQKVYYVKKTINPYINQLKSTQKLWIIISILLFSSNCTKTEYPKELNFKYTNVKILNWNNNHKIPNFYPANRKFIPAPTIAVYFKAKSPFKFIQKEGRVSYISCSIYKNNSDYINIYGTSPVFFLIGEKDSSIYIPKDRREGKNNESLFNYSNSFPSDLEEACDPCSYIIYLFYNLKAYYPGPSDAFQNEINLLTDEYQHISCHLSAVGMLTTQYYSNRVTISREQIKSLYKKYIADNN